ncbi:MAG: GHMP kinase [Candidatus Aminicenantes bacterium]|nr:GHMP kinase [Candidatus Aminicenantes bacterium]
MDESRSPLLRLEGISNHFGANRAKDGVDIDLRRREVQARAPLRVNDIGGWTDTWFAREGWVLNMAVVPPVEVQIKVIENAERRKKRVLLHLENSGESFWVNPDRPARTPHPFLQHIIARLPPPGQHALEVNLFSPVPAGISTGTSAAVCVALLGALSYLKRGRVVIKDIVSMAHRIETEDLNQQSGIQDQICAAYGGVCFIHMHRYPHARVEKLELEPRVWEELDRRLCLVYLGRPHQSSAMHERVIAGLERAGAQWKTLERLKHLPAIARTALLEGDLEGLGGVMVENNECQRALHRELVSVKADAIAGLARKYKASGWKVNGAGGNGGSMTILAGQDDGLKKRMLKEIVSLGKGIRPLPASLSANGLEAWES